MKKILFVSSQFPNNKHPNQCLYNVDRLLALRGAFEVCVVSPIDLVGSRLLKDIGNVFDFPSPTDQPIANSIVYLPFLRPPQKVFGWYSYILGGLILRTQIDKVISTYRPDLIVVSWVPDSLYLLPFQKGKNIPIVCIGEGSDIYTYPKKYYGWGFIRKLINKNLTKLILVSNSLKNEAVKIGLRHEICDVLWNIVDADQFRLKQRINAQRQILIIGRLTKNKRVDTVLRAFHAFKELYKETINLVIVGSGPMKSELVELAEALQIEDNVFFHDEKKKEDLVSFYQNASLVTIASEYEGFGLTSIESMSCGTPVVGGQVGILPEIISESNGRIIKDFNEESLARVWYEMLNYPWDPATIRNTITNRFGQEQYEQKFLRIVNEL